MLHVMKRLLLVVVGYVLAVVSGLIAVVVIYSVLANLPGAPSYFSTMSLSPIVVLLVPPVALIVLYVALFLTCLPALAAALITELFALRQFWLHMLLSAAIGAGAFVLASPEIVGTIEGTDWADLAIVAASGAVGGLIYWLIAGRRAGFAKALPVVAGV